MTKTLKIALSAGALAMAVASGVVAQSASADPAPATTRAVPAQAATAPAATPATRTPANATRPSLPQREPQADISRAAYLERAGQMFDRMDINHDGRLSPEDRAAMADARFSRMDTDGNGAISRTEWNAGADMNQRRETRRGGAAAANNATQNPLPPIGPRAGMGMRMMRGADANNDGVITREEFLAAAAQRFDRLDTDHNGTLTGAEKMADRGDRRGPGRHGMRHDMRGDAPPPPPAAAPSPQN